MKISEVAALAGVPTATVRYYERRGLIAQAPRTGSGYRTYGSDTATRLRFIKRAQDLGFSLEEIQELLGLRVEDSAAAPIPAPPASSALRMRLFLNEALQDGALSRRCVGAARFDQTFQGLSHAAQLPNLPFDLRDLLASPCLHNGAGGRVLYA